ncbi:MULTISPECIES: amino acid ABC transporter permease [unclassified Bosea (in: a-proteobacteria)]|uniref:amino acid ABC transporter permease n=1 Tax=unclassified Bosea (in: a-proteobacteria) TaxID=2653178 RepID=UPI000F765C7B|nr:MULTISPECIES: amino acid ABC transporter permease [unclassified Bosea (in: a-proteobacteria)]AZO79222.1 amino acid ABC transporter permease [Bosea sp. Tri-49]RXT27377.1 amino acid ABC transporter permease [Bosea sp. Tri-39]RXT35918.1 amino acid ABC transporter permease [Bosea sp. Tri-54]
MLEILENNWLLFLVGQYPHGPIGGLAMTLFMASISLALCFPFAIALALARLSPYRWLRLPATAIVHTVRGLPLIMFIFWTYFFSPLIIGRAVGGVETLVIALVIYEAAYLSEIIRAGIEGLPKGQVEAATSLGLRYWPTTFKVVLPQALHNMLPSMVSQFVSTIKETSLGYVISAHELTFAAAQVNNVLLTQPFEVYGILALTYFALCFALTSLARFIERRISGDRGGTPGVTIAA